MSERSITRQPGPLIGISGPRRQRLVHRLIRLGLRLQGAQTRYLRPGANIDITDLDGLVLSGGTHIEPARFGQQPEVAAGYDRARDDTDWALLEAAKKRNLPVLGICRGAQLINVYLGGSLCQNVTPLRIHTRHRPLLLPLQTVQVVQQTRLWHMMRRPRIGANRIHSQAIKRLGQGLRVVAIDDDRFVQAIESIDNQWLMGVQWHPEYLLYHPLHRRLFAALVDVSRERQMARRCLESVPDHEEGGTQITQDSGH